TTPRPPLSLHDALPIYFARHAVRVDFLGATAHVDRAPAALAARTGAPLVVAATRRDPSALVIEVLDVIVPPVRAGRAWIDRATRSEEHTSELQSPDHLV